MLSFENGFCQALQCENSVNNLENYHLLRNLLPKNFTYRICGYVLSDGDEAKFDTRFRVNCSKDDVEEWLRKFQEVALRCYNTQPRSQNVLKPYAKHRDCPARMRITVKSTEKSKQYKSMDLHLGDLPTLVILHYKHNHYVHNAEALKYREPTDEVQCKFLKMFEAGRALDIHKKDLYYDHEDDYYLIAGDSAHCPDISWVYHLYYSVFKEKYGSGSGLEMIKSFQTFVSNYNAEVGENCAAYKCLENSNFVIATMSPLMKSILKTLSTAS